MNKKISEIISNVFERVQDLISTNIQNEITSLKRLISYDPKYFQNEVDDKKTSILNNYSTIVK